MGEPAETGAIRTPPESKPAAASADATAPAVRTDEVGPRTEPKQGLLPTVLAGFLPNRVVSRGVMRIIVAGEILIALVVWLNSPFRVLPRPDEVARALQSLWMTQGLGPELWVSFTTNLEAIGWTALISLALSYLTVVPVFRPLVSAISKGRFLSLVGFT